MLHELLTLLPDDPVGAVAPWIIAMALVAGAALWLSGSRFSLWLMTLAAVSLGTWTGKHLPGWCGWRIDGMAPAVLLAIGLGVSAFTMHRAWVGIALGAVIACWAGMAVWMMEHGQADWQWRPAANPAQASAPALVCAAWEALPAEVALPLPYVCGGAILAGAVAAALWPGAATIALYSLAGASIVVIAGTWLMQHARPQWMGAVSTCAPTWAQLSILAGIVAVGGAVQWWLRPPRPLAQQTQKDEQQ